MRSLMSLSLVVLALVADANAFEISSSAFSDGGAIPREFTCDGGDKIPPLAWSGVPEGTRSLVLIVEDPDVPDPAKPVRSWIHWVVFEIPPGANGIAQAGTPSALPSGTKEGLNDWKRGRYGGPCPPIGRHRYFHKLYALDVSLAHLAQPTKAELEEAMKGHVLASATLIGTYERSKTKSADGE